MDFNQAEEKFRGLKARFAAGDLSEADFKAQLEDLMVEDESGSWWMLGYDTERWYRHDGTSWVQEDPPGRSAAAPASAAAPVQEAAETPAPAEVKASGTAGAAVAPVSKAAPAPAAAPAAARRSPGLLVGLGILALVVCAGAGFLIFNSMGSTPPATQAPEAATEAPVAVQPTEPAAPAPMEPTAAPATEAPTAELVPTADTRFFTEDFDNGAAAWDLFVTSGKADQLTMAAQGGKLSFDLNKRQVWAYAAYTPQSYDDVRIDAEVDNRGNNDNNITLFCRYDKDLGWYELSVANSGLYWIYRGKWDSNGVTASYATIADGGSNDIRQGQAVNTYALVCKGNTITAYINDKLIKSATDDSFRSGNVGIGVAGVDSLPIAVDYNWVKISEP